MCENVFSAQTTILKLQNSFGVVNTVLGQSILVGCSSLVRSRMDMCIWAIQLQPSPEYCKPMALVKPESKFLHSAICKSTFNSVSLFYKRSLLTATNSIIINVLNKHHLNQKYMCKAIHDKHIRN